MTSWSGNHHAHKSEKPKGGHMIWRNWRWSLPGYEEIQAIGQEHIYILAGADVVAQAAQTSAADRPLAAPEGQRKTAKECVGERNLST